MLLNHKAIVWIVLPVIYSCDYTSSAYLRNAICPPEGLAFLPGPKCKQFYFCSNGYPTLLQCHEGENYNPETEMCDEYYICYDSPPSTPPPTTTGTLGSPTSTSPGSPTPPVTLESTTSDSVQVLTPLEQCPQYGTAFQVHDRDCSLYFYCRDSVRRMQQCPFLYYFDMFVGRCLHRTEARCYPGTYPGLKGVL